MRGWIEWIAQGLWRRRSAVAKWTALAVAIAALAVIRTVDWEGRPPRTIDDPAFESAAEALCAEELPKLRATRREERTDDDLEQETAKQVDEVADSLERVVADLRALDVRAQDADEVATWFGHFDDYIEAGRRYAEALRTGDESLYSKVDDEGVAPLQAISRFARGNHIDSCIP